MLPQLNLPCSVVVEDDGFAFVPGDYDEEEDDRDLVFTNLGKIELFEMLLRLRDGMKAAMARLQHVAESEALEDAEIPGGQQAVYKASNKQNEVLKIVEELIEALKGDSSSTEIVSSSDESEVQPYEEFRIPKSLREDLVELADRMNLPEEEQKNVSNYFYMLMHLVTVATALLAYYLNGKAESNAALPPPAEDGVVMSFIKWLITEEPADKLVKKLHLETKRIVL
jgi:hypothetical protein